MALLRRKDEAIQPRIPEIGRIFKGSPKRDREKESGKTYQIMGEDLSYFRFEPADSTRDLPAPDDNSTLAEYLINKFNELGSEPRSLPIQFLSDDLSRVFGHEYNELWTRLGGAERCTRRCDGETTILHLTEDKKLSKAVQPCMAPEDANECPLGCKPVGRLRFVMPCLGYPGALALTTHSIYDISEMAANLAFYDGKLSRIPFQLCRSQKTIMHDDKPLKKWLCHLSVDPRFGLKIMESASTQYLREISESKQPNSDLAIAPSSPGLAIAPSSPGQDDQNVLREALKTWSPAQKKDFIGWLNLGDPRDWQAEQYRFAILALDEYEFK